jgi:hypothetical protein
MRVHLLLKSILFYEAIKIILQKKDKFLIRISVLEALNIQWFAYFV